jgi:hypothetical protein
MPVADTVGSHPDGATFTVWVVPGARRTEIVGLYGDAVKVRVAAPPEKGRANRALGSFLSEQLGSRVRLISGAGSRRKRYVLPGVELRDLIARIEGLLD